MNQPTGPLIYIVDPDIAFLQMLAAMLGPCGYSLQTFTEANAALYSLADATPKPRLLITSHLMRSCEGNLDALNGLELLEKFKEVDPDVKTLLLSGMKDYMIKHVLQNAKVAPDAFLPKPFELDEFVHTVQRLLPDHEHGRQHE
jgi:DNA-binding NtrC family response regulator